MTLALCVFRVGEGRYALDGRRVREVLPRGPAAPAPAGPAWMARLAEHRGEVIPVLDLRRRFGLPEGAGGRRLLVVHERGRLLIDVDAVDGMVHVEREAIVPAPYTPMFPAALPRGTELTLLVDLHEVLRDEPAPTPRAAEPPPKRVPHRRGKTRAQLQLTLGE